MQNSETENRYTIQRLSEILKNPSGEKYFSVVTEEFSSLNADVENFLKNKAIQSSKLNQSSTYIVSKIISEEQIDLVGYFTLSMKVLRISAKNISNSEKKKIKALSYFDETTETFNCPSYLIAQFSRNFNKELSSITGEELMSLALRQTKFLQEQLGGNIVFLECEKLPKLIKFYESQGFKLLDSTVLSKNQKELAQMYRLI